MLYLVGYFLCINLFTGAALSSPTSSVTVGRSLIPEVPDPLVTPSPDLTTELLGQQNSDLDGYEFHQEANAWLRLRTEPASWADARLQCQSAGAVLASPSTSALTKAMLALMVELPTSANKVFTGESSENDGNGDCVAMTGAGAVIYESCTSKLPYFCKVNKKCGAQNGYEWSPRTNSCYKFHRVAKNWHHAAKACLAEGAHLAIINSQAEFQVLRDIFEKNPRHTIEDAYNNVVAIIGFWKWGSKDGEWMTIQGETLAEAGFEEWSHDPPQPDNSGGNEYCGAILRNGLLNDVSCREKPFAFICEINNMLQ